MGLIHRNFSNCTFDFRKFTEWLLSVKRLMERKEGKNHDLIFKENFF